MKSMILPEAISIKKKRLKWKISELLCTLYWEYKYEENFYYNRVKFSLKLFEQTFIGHCYGPGTGTSVKMNTKWSLPSHFPFKGGSCKVLTRHEGLDSAVNVCFHIVSALGNGWVEPQSSGIANSNVARIKVCIIVTAVV